jgi:PAS domain S-box-containing protein
LFPFEPGSADVEMRFARIAQSSPNGIFIIDLVGRRPIYVNPQLARMFGRPIDELLGLLSDALVTIVHADDVEVIRQVYQQVSRAADGDVIDYQYRIVQPDGAARWIAAQATVFARDASGLPSQMLVTAEDITSRREAEATLAESRLRFERIAETMADAVYLFDVASNRNIYFSSRVEAVMGYTAQQLAALGDSIVTTLLHPDDAPVFSARREAHMRLADGEVYETDFRARRPNGEIRWMHSRETVFSRDADGRPKQILGTVKDGTDARLREDNLRADARRKDEFLAMLAHELRNPLAPILSAAQIISSSAPDDHERLQRARQVIERQSRHMAKLVDDLLDVSRSVNGKVALNLEWLDIDQSIMRAMELSRPLIEARQQEIDLHLSAEPLRVYGDAIRLAQVLGNLLNNASKYSPARSTIRVEVAFVDGHVRVAVVDQGAGIAAEFLPHVFDLFSQSARSLDRSEGGLGIGLTLVKTLVELHGGRVTAESAGPEQGSSFVIELPGERSSGEVPIDRARVRSQVDLSVLVVDDNVDSAEMLALLLDSEGYRVECCYDGAEALLRIDQNFDVVVLDIGLPVMDGFGVAEEIRKQALRSQPVLIAVTGYGQPSDIARSRAAGFDHHLVKPVEPDELCRLLDQIALERGSSRR